MREVAAWLARAREGLAVEVALYERQHIFTEDVVCRRVAVAPDPLGVSWVRRACDHVHVPYRVLGQDPEGVGPRTLQASEARAALSGKERRFPTCASAPIPWAAYRRIEHIRGMQTDQSNRFNEASHFFFIAD